MKASISNRTAKYGEIKRNTGRQLEGCVVGLVVQASISNRTKKHGKIKRNTGQHLEGYVAAQPGYW